MRRNNKERVEAFDPYFSSLRLSHSGQRGRVNVRRNTKRQVFPRFRGRASRSGPARACPRSPLGCRNEKATTQSYDSLKRRTAAPSLHSMTTKASAVSPTAKARIETMTRKSVSLMEPVVRGSNNPSTLGLSQPRGVMLHIVAFFSAELWRASPLPISARGAPMLTGPRVRVKKTARAGIGTGGKSREW